MVHLIEKDALVAEIERKKNEITFLNEFANGTKFGLKTAIDIISSLEMKEVDLDKEIDKYICDNFFGSQTMGFFANRTKEEPNDMDMALCAKYFFELGLKAQKGD